MRRVPGIWTAIVLCAGFAPAAVLALPGYANLINGFCREQGAPRVRYTDDGCTLCHHPGTFTAEPAHRVEPAWSEFELGRASGSYSFFCPAPSDTGPPDTNADTAAVPMLSTEPATGAPVSHAEMPWMSLGYPTGHATTESVDATGKPEPPKPTAVQRSAAPNVAASATRPARSTGPEANDGRLQLEKLRKDLGITAGQQSAWAEVQDAVLAARAPPDAGRAPNAAATPSLSERFESQQRAHALRIAQIRAVNTATVRLNASLNDRQQRLLAARLPPLLGEL
jgi:hypothetical protein